MPDEYDARARGLRMDVLFENDANASERRIAATLRAVDKAARAAGEARGLERAAVLFDERAAVQEAYAEKVKARDRKEEAIEAAYDNRASAAAIRALAQPPPEGEGKR